MKATAYIKFLIVGVLFGITLSMAEVVSWYRIYEMFKFQSFHMFGIIGSAVVMGVIIVQLIKRFKVKSIEHKDIVIAPKDKSIKRYLFGGILFGLGWALAGACPGPMFILLGHGVWPILIVILSATMGTLVYGMLREKLPH